MAKGTMLDRLAEAMGTLNKRPRKGLTPRQRVANAQRWNSLADIGESYVDNFPSDVAWRLSDDEAKRWHDAIMDAKQIGILEGPSMYDYNRADNPFLSDNIYKYEEQSEFLDWCRYNRVEPNGRNLKQFRWETYKTLPYRERQWIANKDAVRNYMRDNYTLYGQQPPELKTLRDVDEYWTKNVWNGVEPREGYLEYTYPKRQPYSSIEEFPDDFDYMWRY